jgi:hypothetical protein
MVALSLDDARKLDSVSLALRRGDIAEASKYGRVFELMPISVPTFRGACERALQRQRTNANINLVLGDIDPRDNEIILCHHPAPFLARFGL